VNQHKEDYLIITTSGLALRRQCLAMPVVGFQRGMDLWGDHVAFCQITLTSCYVQTGEDEQLFRSVITVATTPAQVFTGIGLTCEAADDAAAQSALTVLLYPTTVQLRFVSMLVYVNHWISSTSVQFSPVLVWVLAMSLCVCHTPVGTALKWPHISS